MLILAWLVHFLRNLMKLCEIIIKGEKESWEGEPQGNES